MSSSLISASASNWVNRGEPADATMGRMLAYFLDQSSTAAASTLAEHATILSGMVEADSTEVHLVGYLRELRRNLGLPEADPKYTRAVAVALWHIAKVAQVRDLALRMERRAGG